MGLSINEDKTNTIRFGKDKEHAKVKIGVGISLK